MNDVFSTEGLRDYAEGETIFREGDQSFEMYVVQSGHIPITPERRRYLSGADI